MGDLHDFAYHPEPILEIKDEWRFVSNGCQICGGDLESPKETYRHSTGDPFHCVNGCDYTYWYQGLGDEIIHVEGESFHDGPYAFYNKPEEYEEHKKRLALAIERGKNKLGGI